MNAIALHGVSLRLGGRNVLHHVSFTVPQSGFIGVLGPNGAGKTTLMRALLGLVPLAGEMRVLGAPVTRGNPAIGYMPQTRSLIAPGLRGRDVVASAWQGHRWGIPFLGADGNREIDRVLDLVGAAALAPRPIGDLSGGERQRLLLAQALLGRPRLLLLDEPLMSLDPRHQADVVALVRRVQQELGLAVLFSAHDLNPLIGAMDQVLYLGSGHAALGPVDEVITGPVLSRLYGADIEVVRLGGRVFVLSGEGQHAVEGHCHV